MNASHNNRDDLSTTIGGAVYDSKNNNSENENSSENNDSHTCDRGQENTGADVAQSDSPRDSGGPSGAAASGRARSWRRARGPAGPAGTSPAAAGAGRSRATPASRGAACGAARRTSTAKAAEAAGESGPGGADDDARVRAAAPGPSWRSGDGAVCLWTGDAVATLRELPDDHADCVVTSPPYWALRDYGAEGQYGLEPTPDAYVARLRGVFSELARVLRPTGTAWLNLGDSYAAGPPGRTADPMRRSTLGASGSAAARRESVRAAGAVVDRTRFLPRKSLMGMPWRVAMALQADGWILRNALIWHKPAPMPDPVRDRFTCAYEFVFLLVRQGSYRFDLDAVRERPAPTTSGGPGRGRNPGDVWTVPASPYRGAHFATMPQGLAARCVAAGSARGGVVLDPFSGAATTGVAALGLGRRYVGIELNGEYNALARDRLTAARQAARSIDVDSAGDGGGGEHDRRRRRGTGRRGGWGRA